MTDYSALRRLAHEASETEMGWLDRGWLASIMADDWADYVAAVDPEVVLSLIDEVGRWKNIAANQKDRTEVAIEMAAAYRDERDQLKAENEALRKWIDDMSPLKGAPLTGPDLKCLACGGYHYGMSGLPCPKMAPMAQGAKDD